MAAIISAAFDVFIADDAREEVWKVDLSPLYIPTETVTTIRADTHGSATKPWDSPADTPYESKLLVAVHFQADAFVPGTTGGWAFSVGDVTGGEIVLGNDHGDWDAYLDRDTYAWDGRAVTVRLGGYSPALGRVLDRSEEAARTFEIDGFDFGREPKLHLRLRDEEEQFTDEIQQRGFLPTGWMLKGGGSTSDFVAFGDPSALREANEITLRVRWFHNSNLAEQHILGWTSTPYKLFIDSTGHFGIRWKKSTVTVEKKMTATLEDGHPYDLEVQLSGAEVKLRIIPEETLTETEETFSGSPGEFTGRDAHGVGDIFRVFKAFGASDPAPGMIDSHRIWGRALTDDELASMRRRNLTAAEKTDADLLHLVEYDDGAGTTVTDDSATAANGTINGSCPWYESLLGSPDAAGEPLPILFGQVDGAEPRLVAAASKVFIVASHKIQAIDETYEGGTQDHDLDTAYTDVFEFLGATTDAAKRDSLITDWGSFFRLGSGGSQLGVITFDGRGYADGGYITNASAIAQVVLKTFGRNKLAAADLDTSWSTLATDNSATIGLYIRERRTRLDVLEEILGTVGAYTYRKRLTGKQAVRRFEGVDGASILTLTEQDIVSLVGVPTEKPTSTIEVEYHRCWRPMSQDQLLPPPAGAGTPDWSRWLFHQQEHRWAPADSETTRRRHLRAQEMRVPALFYSEADALTEGERRLALFGTPRSALRVLASSKGIQLDRFDVVTVSYDDLSRLGVSQNRYLLGDGRDFVVLGIREAAIGDDDQIRGVVELVLWR